MNGKAGTASCPPTEELRQLLDGSLSGERQIECTQHMDACECCQSRLEGIATEGTILSHVVQRVYESEPGATSAYWPALKALDPHVPRAETPRGGSRPRDESLSFLEPANDTAYLGRLAHFDVMRVIGHGGMGLVLEAFDSKLQRNVAIKVLDPTLVDDEVARQRFCREARAAASITHENVVAVHQVEKSIDGKLPYLVMQLVPGESLEERLLREKKLPLREIVRIAMQAVHGLAAAHAQGLIHRDIKPGNILLEPPQDRVKLTDFGLARVAEDVKLTRTGFVSGTPLYMAPEQAMGGEVDARSDLFSLGAVLYEMCAGQPPFQGNSALAILKQITDVKHRPLRELNPSTPEWLADTIDWLLAKKPGDRIQSAEHLAELLEFQWALMKTSSEELPTVCQVEARKRTIRNRIIATLIGIAFLALGLFGGKFLSKRDGQPVAPAAVPETSDAEPIAVLSADSGTVWSVAFDPTSSKVAMAVEDGKVRIWDLSTKTIQLTLPAHRGIIWATRFCEEDGERFATAGDDGFIKLWTPPATEPAKVFEHRNAVRGIAVSQDHQTIFAGERGGEISVWSMSDEKTALAKVKQDGAVHSVALSPDGETLATAGSDKVVRLWNAKTLTLKLPLEGHTAPINILAFHPDGRRLASAGWDKSVRVWDTGSGQLARSWDGKSGDIWALVYSPDGSKLATGGNDGSVRIWNAERGELLATYLGHKSAIHCLTFNKEGTLLASGGRDGAVRIWKVE